MIIIRRLENLILNLSLNDFSCIKDYLSKFKTLIHLFKDYPFFLDMECCIYIILSMLDSTYSSSISTFYTTREALRLPIKYLHLNLFVTLLLENKTSSCILERLTLHVHLTMP